MDHKIYLKMRREQLFYKDEQIHKMTTIFTQNDNFWRFFQVFLKNLFF